MKLAYYTKYAAQNSGPVLTAFLEGAHRQGFDCVENSLDADLAVIWSVLWSGRMRPNKEIYQHYRTKNCPVLILDVGSIIRGHTWKLAVNNLNTLGHYGHRENLDPNRPRKFDLRLQQTAHSNGRILICLQHQSSHQLSHITSQNQWIVDQVQQLRTYSDRPIDLRPHPRSAFDPGFFRFSYDLKTPKKVPGSYDSYDFDPRPYWAVINCNSSPGILAAVNGVRPLVDHSGLAWPVHCAVNNIEQPYDCDRQQWLIEYSHTEYTIEELSDGIWAKRLNQYLSR